MSFLSLLTAHLCFLCFVILTMRNACVPCGHWGRLLDSYFLSSAMPLSNLLSSSLPFKFHSLVSLKAFLMALIFPLRFSLCSTWCNFTCSISCTFLSLFLQVLLSSLPPPQLPFKLCRWHSGGRQEDCDNAGYQRIC